MGICNKRVSTYDSSLFRVRAKKYYEHSSLFNPLEPTGYVMHQQV